MSWKVKGATFWKLLKRKTGHQTPPTVDPVRPQDPAEPAVPPTPRTDKHKSKDSVTGFVWVRGQRRPSSVTRKSKAPANSWKKQSRRPVSSDRSSIHRSPRSTTITPVPPLPSFNLDAEQVINVPSGSNTQPPSNNQQALPSPPGTPVYGLEGVTRMAPRSRSGHPLSPLYTLDGTVQAAPPIRPSPLSQSVGPPRPLQSNSASRSRRRTIQTTLPPLDTLTDAPTNNGPSPPSQPGSPLSRAFSKFSSVRSRSSKKAEDDAPAQADDAHPRNPNIPTKNAAPTDTITSPVILQDKQRSEAPHPTRPSRLESTSPKTTYFNARPSPAKDDVMEAIDLALKPKVLPAPSTLLAHPPISPFQLRFSSKLAARNAEKHRILSEKRAMERDARNQRLLEEDEEEGVDLWDVKDQDTKQIPRRGYQESEQSLEASHRSSGPRVVSTVASSLDLEEIVAAMLLQSDEEANERRRPTTRTSPRSQRPQRDVRVKKSQRVHSALDKTPSEEVSQQLSSKAASRLEERVLEWIQQVAHAQRIPTPSSSSTSLTPPSVRASNQNPIKSPALARGISTDSSSSSIVSWSQLRPREESRASQMSCRAQVGFDLKKSGDEDEPLDLMRDAVDDVPNGHGSGSSGQTSTSYPQILDDTTLARGNSNTTTETPPTSHGHSPIEDSARKKGITSRLDSSARRRRPSTEHRKDSEAMGKYGSLASPNRQLGHHRSVSHQMAPNLFLPSTSSRVHRRTYSNDVPAPQSLSRSHRQPSTTTTTRRRKLSSEQELEVVRGHLVRELSGLSQKADQLARMLDSTANKRR